MRKDKIINTLNEAETPLSIVEISEETGIAESELRLNLFRLQEEGEVESKEEKGKLKWKSKGSDPNEEKYGKMSETP